MKFYIFRTSNVKINATGKFLGFINPFESVVNIVITRIIIILLLILLSTNMIKVT